MYDFHYKYILENFERCKLLFTDTDSFCYSIPGVEDIYAKMNDNEWFDFSNFPSGHSNYSEENKMVPGKFKDECPNDPILEFAGMYHNMVSIGHTHYQLQTIEALKKSLSPYNDKKWIQKNGDVFTPCSFGYNKKI